MNQCITAGDDHLAKPQSQQVELGNAELALPFVSADETKTDFWKPARSGNYAEDCARGRAYAEKLMTFVRDQNNPIILGSVIRAMINNGEYSAVEIGFCGHLGREISRF